MPENEPVLGAPVARLGAVADALGTTSARLVGGVVAAAVVLAAVAWSLSSSPSGGVDAAVLPRAVSTTSSSAAAAERVVVYVAGAVTSPGVYRVRAGGRVADALDAAGGPLPDADVVRLNLAAVVADGERVYVPRRGEEDVVVAGAAGVSPAGPLNINTATAEQLDALPGIGPSTAAAIVAWRTQHGRFKTVDDLLNVRGIGPAKLDALRAQVRV